MEVIEGYLDFYKRSCFGDEWEARYLKFFDDGIVEIYEDRESKKPQFKINLRDVCDFIAVGHYTKNIAKKPKIPKERNEALLISFPRNYRRKDNENIWLFCSTMDQLNDWMKAFVTTFPQTKDFREKREESKRAKEEDKKIEEDPDRYRDRE